MNHYHERLDMNAIYAALVNDDPGATRIMIAGRISSRANPSPIISTAVDYESAKFFAQSLAIATGGKVHVTYLGDNGEHDFMMHADDFHAIGPAP